MHTYTYTDRQTDVHAYRQVDGWIEIYAYFEGVWVSRLSILEASRSMSLGMLGKNGSIICLTIFFLPSLSGLACFSSSTGLALHQKSYHTITDNFISQTEEKRKDRISKPWLDYSKPYCLKMTHLSFVHTEKWVANYQLLIAWLASYVATCEFSWIQYTNDRLLNVQKEVI